MSFNDACRDISENTKLIESMQKMKSPDEITEQVLRSYHSLAAEAASSRQSRISRTSRMTLQKLG